MLFNVSITKSLHNRGVLKQLADFEDKIFMNEDVSSIKDLNTLAQENVQPQVRQLDAVGARVSSLLIFLLLSAQIQEMLLLLVDVCSC